MTASIQAYSPTGELLFDSTQPRCMRIKGTYPITWVYDAKIYSDNIQAIHRFKGTIPLTWNLSNHFAFSIGELQDGFFYGTTRTGRNASVADATTQFMAYSAKNALMYVY